jgi:hypothetical protein
MPSFAASSFIFATKPSSLPEINSAIATQLSFALAMMIDLINSSTV